MIFLITPSSTSRSEIKTTTFDLSLLVTAPPNRNSPLLTYTGRVSFR